MAIGKKLILTVVFLSFLAPVFAADIYTVRVVTNKPVYGFTENMTVSGDVIKTNSSGSFTLTDGAVTLYISNTTHPGFSNTTATIVSSGQYNKTLEVPDTIDQTHYMHATYTDSASNVWETQTSFEIKSVTIDAFVVYPEKVNYYSGETLKLTAEALKLTSEGATGVANVSISGSVRYTNETRISNFTCTTGEAGSCTNTSLTVPSTSAKYLLEVNDFLGVSAFKVVPFEITLMTKEETGKTFMSTFASDTDTNADAVLDVTVSKNGTSPDSANYTLFINITDVATGDVIVDTSNSLRTGAWATSGRDGKNTTVFSNFVECRIMNISNDYSTQCKVHLQAYNVNTSTARLFSVGKYKITAKVFNNETQTNYLSVDTFFEIKSFSLSVEPKDGFTSGSKAFAGNTVNFTINVKNMTSGAAISTLTSSNFSCVLKDKTGVQVANYTPSWSSSDKAYILAVTVPSTTGDYILTTSATIESVIQSMDKLLTSVSFLAYAGTVNTEMSLKDLYSGTDYIYFSITAENSTDTLNITDFTLYDVVDEDGVEKTYTLESNWTATDDNTTYEWRSNISYYVKTTEYRVLRLDNPKKGGLYTIRVKVNNDTGVAKAKFIIDPYFVNVRPRGENDNTTSTEFTGGGGRMDFSTTDKIFFDVTVSRASHSVGNSMMAFEKGMSAGGMGGMGPETGEGGAMGGMDSGGEMSMMMGGASLSGDEVSGANVSIVKVSNDQIFKEIPLSDLNATCTSTGSDGSSTCSVIPSDGKWTPGWYHIIFDVLGPDGVTEGRGHGGFEARNFYIDAYPIDPDYGQPLFMIKPSANVTFKIQMFDAANSRWWDCFWNSMMSGCSTAAGGLSGRYKVEKILYMGDIGAFTWPPPEYTYTGKTVLTTTRTIQDGSGNFTLQAPAGGWDTGMYNLILSAQRTNDAGNVTAEDYGEAMFMVKNWDVFAQPVDTGAGMQGMWRDAFSVDENITLNVNVMRAGFAFGMMGFSQSGGEGSCGPGDACKFCSWGDPSPYECADEADKGQASGDITIPCTSNQEACEANSGCEWNANMNECKGAQFLVDDGTNITIGVKRIMDFSSFPPKELSSSLYTYNTLNLNKATDMMNYGTYDANYIMQIAPATRWSSGFYDVLLDVNGTETGFGFFDVIAFDAKIQLVDANQNGRYNHKGGTSPVFFMVTSSKRPFSFSDSTNTAIASISTQMTVNYTGINTTIREVMLRTFSEESWFPTEYSYKRGDIFVTNMTETGSAAEVNGSAFINVTKASGAWSSGWYDVEITVADENGTTSMARTWFNMKAFEVSAYSTGGWQLPATSNATFQLAVMDPEDWSARNANYTITAVSENQYGFMGPPTVTALTNFYCYDAAGNPTNHDTFNKTNQTVLQIAPSGTSWGSGFHDVRITVMDNASSTATAWAGFDIQPFRINLLSYPWQITAGQNITVNVNNTDEASLTVTAFQQDWMTWPPTITSFYLKNADQDANGKGLSAVMSNHAANIAIIKPEPSGWEKEWYDITLKFNDSTNFVEQWLWLSVIQPYQGWPWPASYEGTTVAQNVTMYVEVYNSSWDVAINEGVNISKIEYLNWNNVPIDWWMTHVEPPKYTDAKLNYRVSMFNGTTCEQTEAKNFTFCESQAKGQLDILAPTVNWTPGMYDMKITVAGSSGTGKLYGWFDIMTETGYYYDTNVAYEDIGYSDCSTDCYYCYNEQECIGSGADCRWTSDGWCEPKMDMWASCDSSNCWNCMDSNECSTAGCTWDSTTGCAPSCDGDCYSCGIESTCSVSTSNCTWTTDQWGWSWCETACYSDCTCSTQSTCDYAPDCYWDTAASQCKYDCFSFWEETPCTNAGCTWSSNEWGGYCDPPCSDNCHSCSTQTDCNTASITATTSNGETGCSWVTDEYGGGSFCVFSCTTDCSCDNEWDCWMNPMCTWTGSSCKVMGA